MTGLVTKVDPHDSTLCVRVTGVGELWFAPGSLVHPASLAKWKEWTAMDAAQRRENERLDNAVKEARAQHENIKVTSHELETQVRLLTTQLNNLKAANSARAQEIPDLQWRIDRQKEAKARATRAIEALRKRRNRIIRRGRDATQNVQQDWGAALLAADSRNEYFDHVRQLMKENKQLKEQIQKDKNNQKSARKRLEKDLKASKSERAKIAGEEQRNLAWLAGRADAAIKELAGESRRERSIQGLTDLRDVTLEVLQSLKDNAA